MNFTCALIRAWLDNHLRGECIWHILTLKDSLPTKPSPESVLFPMKMSHLFSKMSHFKSVTIGNAFLLARHHDTCPHVQLLRYLELNLQVGSAVAELSIFVHYTSPRAGFSACFAETCALTLKEKFFL